MTIELKTYTVGEMVAQLGHLVEQGLPDLPVCATDGRARYPFQAYTVLSPAGYRDAVLLYVRPDAHFAQPQPLPVHWAHDRVAGWNEIADEVKRRCGAFGDRHLPDMATPVQLRQALQLIYDSVQPGAATRLTQLRGLTAPAHLQWIARTAGAVLGLE
jgi:hypothetical protein